jgi:hypothetical protein
VEQRGDRAHRLGFVRPSISMRTVAPTDAVSSITATMLRALARLPLTDSDTLERNFDAMPTMRAQARACKPNGLTTDTSLVCMDHHKPMITRGSVARMMPVGRATVLVVHSARWFRNCLHAIVHYVMPGDATAATPMVPDVRVTRR